MGKILRGILIVFFTIVLCISGWKVYTIQSEYSASAKSYGQVAQWVTMPSEDAGAGPSADMGDGENTEDSLPWPKVDFDVLASINPDIIGWIYIPGTMINYPVVKGTDNDRYLDVMFTGENNGTGCIFIDFRNNGDFSDPNSVLYGHAMQNGSMFAGLAKYKEQAFYDEHKLAMLLTPEKNYKMEIFSTYVAEESADAWQLDFGAGEYAEWLASSIARSGIVPDVELPTPEERVVTLSTCSYEFSGARFVVLGVLR